jgi:RNA methyltransferase, TrmH family
MLSKKEIKDIQSLKHKKFRKELKLFIAEGPKIVGELWQMNPSQFEKIYATKKWMENALSGTGDISIEITEEELEKISELKSANQVVAVLRQFPNELLTDSNFSLYLDSIQDPGNLGTIIRIADWFNVKQVVCNDGCADIYNSKVVQSTMASIARVNIYYDEDGDWFKNQGLPVYAATLDGVSIYDHEKFQNAVLVIGNESRGISDEVMSLVNRKITIPRRGNAESLNAAVATGIILSHLLR